jgi:tRNA modification GTPase
VLREAVVVDGVPFLFHDTAGLRREVTDRVEAIGVDRAESALQSADVVLFVLDASEASGLDEGARRGLRELDAARSIVVLNKMDLPAGPGIASLRPDLPRVRVSATTGLGIDALWSEIRRLSGSDAMARMARERVILNARLAGLLADARGCLRELAGMLAEGDVLELSAQRAREVLARYEEATGRRYQEGLLDTIFARFCIGK